MNNHPLNLGLRFILEMIGLFAIGAWAAAQAEGITSALLAIGAVVIAAAAWGTFNVKDDPGRSGKAPIPVPGILRLILEIVILSLGVMGFAATGNTTAAIIYALVLIGHYIVSYDRVLWLIHQR